MSLRLKFGVLLGLLAAAVVLVLAACWWTFDRLQGQVREPLQGMTAVLKALGETKRAIEEAGSVLGGAIGDPSGPGGVRSLRAASSRQLSPDEVSRYDGQIDRALSALARSDPREWPIRSGSTSLTNLNSRIRLARDLAHRYFALSQAAELTPTTYSQSPKDEAGAALFRIHELIENIERHIVAETEAAIRFGDAYPRLLFRVLVWALVTDALALILGLILIRRWILQPVASLRIAAARIAEGDFAYRIALAGAPRGDELHNLSAEVNHMAGMVKAMQDERVERERLAALGEMVRRLAHNLRNPLAGIRGLAEITLGDLDPQARDLRENQDRIIRAVDRFEKWLNDLLTATRPMIIQPQPTQVVPWITGLVEAHRPQAQTKGVQLDLDTAGAPAQAEFDPSHLEHALSAILSNAIEATSGSRSRGPAPAPGRVQVTVRRDRGLDPNEQDKLYWTVSVRDQGQGVPPDLRDSIFRPYFTTKRDGSGIGLAVALHVVKAHGGTIQVESPYPVRENGSGNSSGHVEEPAGSCFTIRIPANRPVLANEPELGMAKIGRSGAPGGQNTRH